MVLMIALIRNVTHFRYVSKPWLSGVLSLDSGSLSIQSTACQSYKVMVSQLHCSAHHPSDTAISFKSAAFRHCAAADSSSSLVASPTAPPVLAMINVDFASVQAVEQWSADPAPRPPSPPEFQPSHHVSSATHVSHPHLHLSFTLFLPSYSLPSIYFTLFSRSNIICNCQESLAPVVPHSRLTRESSFQVYKTSEVLLSANIQKQQQRPALYSPLKITELV